MASRMFTRAFLGGLGLVVSVPGRALAAAKPGPPWTYYMSYGTAAIIGIVVLVAIGGYAVQSRGWGRKGRGSPPGGGPSR